MKGILVHTTTYEYFDSILKAKSLKPPSETDGEGNGVYYGPDIFFHLVTEDKDLQNGENMFGFGRVQFFLKPTVMKKYGMKKFVPTKRDIQNMKYHPEDKEFPKYKCWYNNAWIGGNFYKKDKEYKSVNYDPSKSLQENIQIFHDTPEELMFGNELILRSKSIPLQSNLLLIFIKDSNEAVQKYKEAYPMYTFTNDRNILTNVINFYYEHTDF